MNDGIPRLLARLAVVTVFAGSCVQVQPPADTGNVVGPTLTSPLSTTGPLAYIPDMKPLFDSDCVLCHGTTRADDGYRMDTYAFVMAKEVFPGVATSGLVHTTQPSGKMYRYWSGNAEARQAKARLVASWVVTYQAQERR